MKLKKILAAVSATAVAATTLAAFATTASAAEIDGLPKYAPIELNSDSNMVQVELASFEGITEANIVSVDFTIKPHEGTWGPDGWFGGGFGIGIQTADAWTQIDVAGDGTDDIATGWAAAANGGTTDTAYSFTFTLPEGSETPFLKLDEDEESATYGQMVSAGPLQFGYWWGSNGAIDITELTVNFDDGSSIAIVDPSATTAFDKTEYVAAMNKIVREKAAADALAALEDAIEKLGVTDAISDMEAAAEALTNAKDVLAKADDAAAEIASLEDVLAAAEEAFAALQEGDTADKEAYEAAKNAVETAKTDLETAKADLQAAMEAYDKATADKLAEKDEKIAGLEDEKAALEAELAELKAQAEADAAKIAELESTIAEKDAEIAALEDEKAALAADLEEALKNGGSTATDDKPADDNPATGVAVAFGGLALAAVAAVATKKRK